MPRWAAIGLGVIVGVLVADYAESILTEREVALIDEDTSALEGEDFYGLGADTAGAQNDTYAPQDFGDDQWPTDLYA